MLHNFELKVFWLLATVVLANVGVMVLVVLMLGFRYSGCSGLGVGTGLVMMILETVVVLEVVVVVEVVKILAVEGGTRW